MKLSSYIKGNSFYYKIDSRAKIIITVLTAVLAVMDISLFKLSVLFIMIMLLSLSSIRAKNTVLLIKSLLPLSLCIIIFAPLRARNAEALFTIGEFTVLTDSGVIETLKVLLRFLSISSIFSLLLKTERMEMITRALEKMHLPYKAGLMFSLSLSLIPSLADKYSEIRLAQKTREGDGRKIPLTSILVSLTVDALKRIPDSAAILEERGFENGKRSSIIECGSSSKAFTEIFIFAIFFTVFILL